MERECKHVKVTCKMIFSTISLCSLIADSIETVRRPRGEREVMTCNKGSWLQSNRIYCSYNM